MQPKPREHHDLCTAAVALWVLLLIGGAARLAQGNAASLSAS